MKTAVRTIARYETVRPPKGKALSDLMQVAMETGNEELGNIFRNAFTGEIGVAGKFTQLGALASCTIPKVHADLALLLHNLRNKNAPAAVKVREAIQTVEAVIPELEKLNIYLPRPEQTAEEE